MLRDSIVAILVLVARGLLAWIYLPGAALVWSTSDQGLDLRHFLRWVDLNALIAFKAPFDRIWGRRPEWIAPDSPLVKHHRILTLRSED